MNRSIRFPDELHAAAVAAGVDVPEVCREAIRAAVDGEHQAHEDTAAAGELGERLDGIGHQLRGLAVLAAIGAGVAVLALVLATVALRDG